MARTDMPALMKCGDRKTDRSSSLKKEESYHEKLKNTIKSQYAQISNISIVF
ncbi:hypothetical protein GCM10022378_08840 [Salinicoccus jeotgali]|uniref:Uncharacterized protein n=1 Tax=Salinicoccus jeotgali TaxID=381634 RepID=A0ABP7EM44_9STAP